MAYFVSALGSRNKTYKKCFCFRLGLTLIELMVGVSVSLLIIGIASYFYHSLLKDLNRHNELAQVESFINRALNSIGEEVQAIAFFDPRHPGVEYTIQIKNTQKNIYNNEKDTYKLAFYHHTLKSEIVQSIYQLEGKVNTFSDFKNPNVKKPLYTLYKIHPIEGEIAIIPHIAEWRVRLGMNSSLDKCISSYISEAEEGQYCYAQWLEFRISVLSETATQQLSVLQDLKSSLNEQLDFINKNQNTFIRRFKIMSAL